MKLLHTSDWHVGKTLKGRNRLDEQQQVLAEIVDVAREHEVDAVLVAGDLYENVGAHRRRAAAGRPDPAAPCARPALEVIAIAGNHDHARTFEAYRPLMGVAGIHLFGSVRPADRGGVVQLHRPLHRRAGRSSRCCRSCPSATPSGPPS